MKTALWGGVNLVYGYFKQDSEGNLIKFIRSKNGDGLYARPRKKYTRTHPYPTLKINDFGTVEPIRHQRALPREKAALIMLRRLGSYSINQLSKASGRSCSWIHKVLTDAKFVRSLRFMDNRKLPRKAILYTCRKKLISCFEAFKLWQPFILGEEEEPP